MSRPENASDTPIPRTRFAPFRYGRRGVVVAAAIVGAFAAGGAVAAVALHGRQPALVMLTPAPITAMHDWSGVAVKGQVAEIFGNKFIIQDDSGRALVDLGRAGERGTLVAKSETVTVQGRFDHGFIHAQAVSHSDGRNDLLGPGRPPRGPLAQRGPAGGPGELDPH